MNSTKNLLQEHLIVRRLGSIANRCSDGLYTNQDIPIEHIQIISVVMEEFVDAFHHDKEEKAYFPVTKDKNSFSEDIRKFLIEHELGRKDDLEFQEDNDITDGSYLEYFVLNRIAIRIVFIFINEYHSIQLYD